MSFVKTVGVAAAAFVALAASSAYAATLTIGGGVAAVSCTPSCAGIIGGSITSSSQGTATGTAGSLDAANATLYSFSPSDPATEAAALNVLAGTNSRLACKPMRAA